jgi:ABC-2 type transport system permease protein
VLPLARYAGIWLAQIRYTIMRELMFKSNFILWIIVDLSWFGLHLSFIQFLYLQVNTVAGWTNGKWCCWSPPTCSSSKSSRCFS